MKAEELSFTGAKETKIAVHAWRPTGTVRASLAIVHGFKAHGGLYDGMARELARAGIAVYAMDLRGNGRSEGERYWVESFADYQEDVAGFMALVERREPGLPVFLLGHSAGGVISCAYALEHQTKLAGFICESFAYRVYVPGVGLAALRGLSHLTPHVGVLKLETDAFSRDPAFVERMKTDPLIVQTPGPMHTVAEMARANDHLEAVFSRMTMPLLVMHGTLDRVTEPAGSQELFDKASSVDKTLRLYEGHFHDLFNDVGGDVVLAETLAWMEARLLTPWTSAAAGSAAVPAP